MIHTRFYHSLVGIKSSCRANNLICPCVPYFCGFRRTADMSRKDIIYPAIEYLTYTQCCSRGTLAHQVGAAGDQCPVEDSAQGSCHRVCSHAHRNRFMFPPQPLWYIGACRNQPCNGAWPALQDTFPDRLFQICHKGQQVLELGADQYEAFGYRTFFECQQVEDGKEISRITAEAIYRFGRIGDDTALSDYIGCMFQMPIIYRRRFDDISRPCVYFFFS